MRAFRENPMLHVGGFTLLLLLTAIVLGPFFSDHDPTRLRPWLGAQPPGHQSPDLPPQLVLERGKAPVPHLFAGDVQHMQANLRQGQLEEVRVQLRDGVVRSILRLSDATSVEVLGSDDPDFVIASPDGRSLDNLKKLAVGEKPEGLPAGLSSGRQVVMFKVGQRRPRVVSADLKEGMVVQLKDNTGDLERIEFQERDVEQWRVNGRARNLCFWLGSDELGRDVLSRILHGGRISLLVGLAASMVSVLIGVLYGSIAGYYGGRTDRLMMSGVDILYAIPFMFLVILLLVYFGRDIIVLFVALGAVQWLTMSRIVRTQILSLKAMEFVRAARMCGTSHARIIWLHMIPNTLGIILVYATLTVPAVILEESFLSFIGLQVQYNGQNLDSWGALVDQGMRAMGKNGEKSWLLIAPAGMMTLTLLALNCLGDGLADRLDPRRRQRR